MPLGATVQTLQSRKDAWAATSVKDRIAILDRLIGEFAAMAGRWVAASAQAKEAVPDIFVTLDEWENAYVVVRHLRVLRQALADISVYGRPRIPGRVTTRSNGQVVAQVFPYRSDDRLIVRGTTIEVWMEPGVTIAELPQTQALAYRAQPRYGRVALVLGGGNVSSLSPLDVLHKMFVENQVVVMKLNPVNASLGPLLEEGFRALIEAGYLRVVHGGAAEGTYLCHHPGVDEVHVTGSDKTHDAIVFGPGPEGAARKAAGRPVLTKRITSELGNVSPWVVVPGPWSERDLAYAAEFLVTTLVNNGGFNCNTTRVIIQQRGWSLRERFLQHVRALLARVPLRTAFYPGSRERHQRFLAAHPEAEQFGTPRRDQLPWTLITDVTPDHPDDICFTTEAFCGVCAETAIAGATAADFLDRAVDFANNHLYGTLTASLIVHPGSLQDRAASAALERAIADLRYGTVAVNDWGAVNFSLGVGPWGAFPGHPVTDIQSGSGVVHNPFMFARPQKAVLRAPFRSWPKPIYFLSRARTGVSVYPKLCQLEASPSGRKVLDVVWTGLRR